MKPSQTRTDPLRALWIGLGFLFAAAAFAQTANTGTISGRVFNPATGEYVRDAEIRLQGTGRIVATESDGSFSIADVPSGPATITVSYTGYATATEAFTVSPGATATREINLVRSGTTEGDGTIILQSFVVSSDREGNAKAIMAQRRNMNITTSVASDVFGEVAAGNVGEFLKFLPGVDVEYVDTEARGPRLGGLDPQYVGVTMDGARLASADAFSAYNGLINGNAGEGVRSVSFEQMSINSIESVEVNRTTSADMDADSPAGSIDLKTKRGFDRKGRRIDWQFSLSANSGDLKWGKTTRSGEQPRHLIRPNTKLDYSDVFFNRRLGVSLGFSESKVLYEVNSITHTFNRAANINDPRPVVLTGWSFVDGPALIDRHTASLNLDFKASSRLVLSMTALYTTYLGENGARSVTFTAANNNANVVNGRSTVLGDGLTEIRTNGAANNTGRTIGITGGQSFDKKTRNLTFTPKFEYKWNRLTVDGMLHHSRSLNRYHGLPNKVRANTTNNLTGIDFIATRADANTADWTIRQVGGPNWSDLSLYTNPRATVNEGRMAEVEVYHAGVNARYNMPWRIPTFFKVGGKIVEEYRKSENKNALYNVTYVGPGGNPILPNGSIGTTGSFANFPSAKRNATQMGNGGSLNISSMPVHVNREALATAYMQHPEWFVSTTTAANYFAGTYGNDRDFKQSVPAAYVLGNTRVGKWQLQAGLRWELTETTAKAYDPLPAAQVVAAGYTVGSDRRANTIPGLDFQYGSRPKVKRTAEYDHLFPSFSAKYSLTPNLQAQFGYSHAISRPPINALAGIWEINDLAMTVIAPNTALKPETSNNYVARLAYYFEPVGSLTFLVQQNEITDIRETRRFTADEFGFANDPAYEGYEFISTINGDQLFRYRNMEVGYNQQLSFLPGVLNDTNINLSYSRSYANRRRPGTVPHKVSGSVAWRYKRFNLRLSGIWLDDAQWTTVVGRYQRRNAKFDLNAGFRLTQRTNLFLQARNITNEPVRIFEPIPGTDLPPVLQRYASYGTSWILGIKGTF